MNNGYRKPLWSALCLGVGLLAVSLGAAQEIARPVRVSIKDGKLLAAEAPVDPMPRIEARANNGMMFGLTVAGTRITCTPDTSVFNTARIDGQALQPGFDPQTGQPAVAQPLPPGPFGKKRLGTQTHWQFNKVHITQLIEVIPSRLTGGANAEPKRKLDTVRVTYLIENKDTRDHQTEFRTFIDTMIANNDGALFASPTTAPGEILDGMVLRDRKLPEYLQVLERPDLRNPGFVAALTLKFGGKSEGPTKVVLSNTQALAGDWDVNVQKANGDSACFLFWPAKNLKPGEKRSLVWAYGGGVASDSGFEDNVALSLSGSFEPGKLFTVMATVDDPIPGQSLTLELPTGLERIEGKAHQPVPTPNASGTSAVLWKARVVQLGDYELRVRSSTGVTQVKNISIQAGK